MLLSTLLILQRLNEAFSPQEHGKLQTPFFLGRQSRLEQLLLQLL